MTAFRENRAPLVAPGGADLHVQDMTATFAADVSLASAQEQLAAHDQWLAIDGDPSRPLGELIAHNSTGPLRLGFGGWRDLLLGVQFRLQSGELITAGGQTVKNVAGYDLTKLMVGQHGRLGEMVTLTARTYRRPAGGLLAVFEPSLKVVRDLLPTPLRPQWMLIDAEGLSCGYLGDETALAYYRRKLVEISPRSVIELTLADDIANRAGRWQGQYRLSLPPANVMGIGPSAGRWVADPAFGIVRCDGDLESLRAKANELGGTVVDPPAEAPDDKLLKRLTKAFT